MIEELSPQTVKTMFSTGASVRIHFESEQPWTLSGIISDWSGDSCEVRIIYQGDAPPLGKSACVALTTSRLDGVFSTAAKVSDLVMDQSPMISQFDDNDTRRPAYQGSLTLAVDLSRGKRMQQRAFFRLAGKWSAHICYPLHRNELDNIYHHANVRNLSANGLLLEDNRDVLSEGRHFRVLLELTDGSRPIPIDAQVARKDEHYLGVSSLWGCRFVRVEPEDEARIVQSLNERIRSCRSLPAGA